MSEARSPVGPGGLLGDRYEIVRELGRGGMGVVYACLDRVTNARVAVKRVERAGRAVAAGDTFWFHQEARALASLDHPAIVHARDFGVLHDGSPFLVMDLVGGRSLHQWMDLGPPPWHVTWSIGDQVLAALAHAHARYVIHGDLKPQNILVETNHLGDPEVHVLDFGLAFLLTDRHDPRLDGQAASKPAMPYGGGTPGFMAPEQIRRAVPHVGPPTDLYALGCILFQLLTGRPPYIATKQGPRGLETDEELLLKMHKSAPVPTPQMPAEVPNDVAALVVRLLAKRPWRRFDFAADVRNRWEAFRPTAGIARAEGDEDDDDDDVETLSLRSEPPPPAPDTRIDVLTIAAGANAREAVPTRPENPPELLGLRPLPMMGRGNERTELFRLLDVVAAPNGPKQRMIVLTGEAGVGKSRLAEWLCERAHERGAMIPLKAPYRKMNGPLDGLNGAVLHHYGLERVDRILVEQALINTWEIEKDDDEGMTWVAATAEWLRPSSITEGGHDRERRSRERSSVGPTGKRFTLDEPELRWLVIRRVFERIARDRPILLWLDDLHHAPVNTFEGIAKMRRDAPNLRMLIVATARHEALIGDPAIEHRLDTLRRAFGGPHFALGPLDAADTHALLRTALPLDDRAIREAETRSKGNPLFALQLLHSWASSGGLELVGQTYRVREEALARRATTTGELWDERLASLEEKQRAAAEAAAALGVEFRGDVLRRLTGHVVGIGGFGADVARTLEALQRAHILVATGEDRFRFPHLLLQEHLLARLAARADAATVFRNAADALSIHPLAGTRRILRHRVANLLRAGDGEAAATLLLGFVAQAWSRVRDASRTLEDLAILETPAAAALLPPRIAAQHARWKAEALRHAGRFDEAREAAQRARKTFLANGDDAEDAYCMRLLGHIATEQGDPTEGRRLVARALTVFDRLDDERGRASCEVVIGEIDYLLGDHLAARDELHRGARRFRAIADPLGCAQCLLLLGFIELAEGVIPKARELLVEARADFDQIGYRLGISQCDVALAHVEHRGGDLDAAHTRALATRDALRALENPRGIAGAERLLAMIAIDRDDAIAAAKHARAALDLYEKLGDPWGILESRLLLVQQALVRGALEDAKNEMKACDEIDLDEAEPQQHRALTRAWLLAAGGDGDGAARALEEAQRVFADPKRMGDHAAQLLVRFDARAFPPPANATVRAWLEIVGGLRASTGSFPVAAN